MSACSSSRKRSPSRVPLTVTGGFASDSVSLLTINDNSLQGGHSPNRHYSRSDIDFPSCAKKQLGEQFPRKVNSTCIHTAAGIITAAATVAEQLDVGRI